MDFFSPKWRFSVDCVELWVCPCRLRTTSGHRRVCGYLTCESVEARPYVDSIFELVTIVKIPYHFFFFFFFFLILLLDHCKLYNVLFVGFLRLSTNVKEVSGSIYIVVI
jgi:hypothetical protein